MTLIHANSVVVLWMGFVFLATGAAGAAAANPGDTVEKEAEASADTSAADASVTEPAEGDQAEPPAAGQEVPAGVAEVVEEEEVPVDEAEPGEAVQDEATAPAESRGQAGEEAAGSAEEETGPPEPRQEETSGVREPEAAGVAEAIEEEIAEVKPLLQGATRYVRVTLRGRLIHPEKGSPVAGAIIRFASTGEDGIRSEAATDAEGKFEASGLSVGSYAVEVETPDGERVRGVGAVNLQDGQPIEIALKVSDQLVSDTTLHIEPKRAFAVVDKRDINWRRFWKEFATFFGVTAVAGIAAD